MKIWSKLAIALILTIGIQGNCYAGKPQNCFMRTYKDKQHFNEKKFVKEYLSTGFEFMSSQFYKEHVVYIPFRDLTKIINDPSVKNYFYENNHKHSRAMKRNPSALIKFIVDNQRIYGPVVYNYLQANPNLKKVDLKKRIYKTYVEIEVLFKTLGELPQRQFLLIQNPAMQAIDINDQLPIAISETNNNHRPLPPISSLMSELNHANERVNILQNEPLGVETNDKSETFIPPFPILSKED